MPDKPTESTFRAAGAMLALGFVFQVYVAGPVPPEAALAALAQGVCAMPFYLAAFVLGVVIASRGDLARGLALVVGSAFAPVIAAGVKLGLAS